MFVEFALIAKGATDCPAASPRCATNRIKVRKANGLATLSVHRDAYKEDNGED